MSTLRNGTLWLDDAGAPIQAHGGMILAHQGVYYWYGEHKGRPNCPGTTRVDVIGISCYSSRNLTDWHYEGLVLTPEGGPEAGLRGTGAVWERPRVLYCEATGAFVLWLHVDTPDYVYAGAGVAVSSSPTGPFRLLRVKQPNRQDARDLTVFTDVDGRAYLIHSANWNKTLNIARLTEDFQDVDGFYLPILIDQEREAPALLLHNGLYYLLTSGCTGWDCNSALYATAPSLLGRWKLIDDPCEGPGRRLTFHGQGTWLLQAGERVLLLLDHWVPHDLRSSGYSLLPVTLEDGVMTVQWTDTFSGL